MIQFFIFHRSGLRGTRVGTSLGEGKKKRRKEENYKEESETTENTLKKIKRNHQMVVI